MRTSQSDLMDMIQRKRNREAVEDKGRIRSEIHAQCEAFLSSGGEVQMVTIAAMRAHADATRGADYYKRGRDVLAKNRARRASGKNNRGVPKAGKNGGLDSQHEECLQQIPVRPEGEDG